LDRDQDTLSVDDHFTIDGLYDANPNLPHHELPDGIVPDGQRRWNDDTALTEEEMDALDALLADEKLLNDLAIAARLPERDS
jgi:hypothetical protein